MTRSTLGSPQLKITLLGGFDLRVDEQNTVALPRKARALLAYLIMQDGRAVSREAVGDLLWTDRGVAQVRHSLRQTLLVLRRDLESIVGEVIQVRNGTLTISPGVLDADITRLQHQFASVEREDLTTTALLYTGPLLDGFPPISAGFDEWLARERNHVEDSALNMLGRLADNYGDAGHPNEAVLITERMLAIDPLREDLHRRLMTAYVQAGRRSDAIRQYHTCVEMLRRELDVPPSPETEALFRRVHTTQSVNAAALVDVGSQPPKLPARQSDGPPWIAILPFRVQTSDEQDEWFAEGIIDGIIHILSGIENISVIARGTSLSYLRRELDPWSIGSELGVRYLLTGSVRRAKNRLRIYTELVDAVSGKVLRSAHHDGIVAEVFDMQDEIARSVVSVIAPAVREYELNRAMRKPPQSLTAYDLLLQGVHLLYALQKSTHDRARELLHLAIAQDPDYGPAYSHVATWHAFRIAQGWSPKAADDAVEAVRYSATAIERDDHDAVALAIHGQMFSFTRREYDVARHFLDLALAAGPSCHLAWALSSTTAGWIGDGDRAIAHTLNGRSSFLRLIPLLFLPSTCFHRATT